MSSNATPRINYSRDKKRAKKMFGKQGNSEGHFIWPIGVAVNTLNNQILVADSNNHRIQVFESDGKFVKSFGKKGKRDSQFDSVSGIFIDQMSNIFVADRLNHRIQMFDRYCRFVRSIGFGNGSSPGELNYPWGICVSRLSEIFICDKENDSKS
jgi:tripartite motif-containing protein 71